jgi:DNA mismatch endonuclease (patch repair protein)
VLRPPSSNLTSHPTAECGATITQYVALAANFPIITKTYAANYTFYYQAGNAGVNSHLLTCVDLLARSLCRNWLAPYKSRMVDRLSPKQRSWNMSRIRGRNTRPELYVRSLLHSLGYRFRVNLPGLRGKPDIAFPKRRKVIFIHGCFWHRHQGCRFCYTPKSRHEFWKPKFARNVQRDTETTEQLKAEGWDVLVVWECEVKQNTSELKHRLVDFLGPPSPSGSSRETER